MERKKNATKKWHLAHPEKLKQASYKHMRTVKGKYTSLKANAKAREHIVNISFEEFALLMSQPCFYCGGVLPSTGGSLDRVNSSLGYISNNVRPCCLRCNRAKNDMTEIEFREWIIRVYNKGTQ